jgi:hypothetical protein
VVVRFVVVELPGELHMALDTKAASLTLALCPQCEKFVLDWGRLVKRSTSTRERPEYEFEGIYPKFRQPSLPAEVPPEVARDAREAMLVASISRRAGAALGRRALQAALRLKGFGASSNKLYDEIEVASQSPDTPTTLREKLHFVRDVGNDGAHPNLDYQGAFVEVEEDDLNLLFETLREFFDVFFVRPARHAATMEARKKRKGKA